jgi:aspartyl-tRNA(Asn)/glutamyl-tRNA(Gln) amidotransferase subunit A
VATRIRRGATMMAHEYLDLLQARQRWIRIHGPTGPSRGYDAVLSPTVPILAPTAGRRCAGHRHGPRRQDAARDEAFFRANALLLRNTSVVNMLDGCALSLPCHTPDELPVGLMIWHAAGRDDPVLNIGLRIEELLQIQ